MIEIDDFFGFHKINSFDDLKRVLSARDNVYGANALEIYINESLCPYLDIFIKDDMAVLHYFFCDDEPPFISQNENRNSLEYIDFIENINGATVGLPSNCVLSVEEALEAIKEFIDTKSKPLCIKWLAL
jgi:hypothetical protein